MKNHLRNQKGQALIFVVGTMTIAMAIGVGVAVRNLSSISRSSRTDTATRAQAAAEAGVENYLTKTDDELNAIINEANDPGPVILPSDDNIQVTYDVDVARYGDDVGSGDYLSLLVDENDVVQVFLSDDAGANYSVSQICWSKTGEDPTNLFITTYSENAQDVNDITNVGLTPSSAAVVGNDNYETAPEANGNPDFDYCFGSPDLPSNPSIMRIRSIAGSSNVGVYPGVDGFPAQGFEITSVGKLLSATEETDDVESKVVVRKSFSYLPGFFDLAIYSGEGL